MEDDMHQWLAHAKHTWRALRASNKRRREQRLLLAASRANGGGHGDDDDDMGGHGGSGGFGHLKPGLRAGLSGYIKQAAQNVHERPWHIVSIAEDELRCGGSDRRVN
jgi:hypothetical protein